MKISMVINVYIDTKIAADTIYDHPTSFERFEETNTFAGTFASIQDLEIPPGNDFELYVIATAANQDLLKDAEIKEKIHNIVQDSRFKTYIITNSDIERIKEEDGFDFLSTEGYCALRNLGFILPYYSGADIVAQIDDDEILKKNYISKMLDLFKANPHIYMLSGLYEESNSLVYNKKTDFKTWQKDVAMNEDRKRVIASSEPIEIMYGMGGNMMIKRAFFSKICYPQKIPRGEDFALLLSAYLVYYHGNDRCGIESGNEIFRTYCTSEPDLAIIHKQPYSAKSNVRKYLKTNFMRFILQRNAARNLDMDIFRNLSVYMFRMTMPASIMQKIDDVYAEAVEERNLDPIYAELDKAELKKLYEDTKNRDLFSEYKAYQAQYLIMLKDKKMDVGIFEVA